MSSLALAQESRAIHEYGRLKAEGASMWEAKIAEANMPSTLEIMHRVSTREAYFWRKSTLGEMKVPIPSETELGGDVLSQENRNQRQRDRKSKLRAMARNIKIDAPADMPGANGGRVLGGKHSWHLHGARSASSPSR
jgi:hypothetical protein